MGEKVAQPAREFFPQLTSVRFFAAFLVVCYHYEKLIADYFPLPIKNLIHHGYVGVSFFFILSGFILGMNYYQKFADGKGDIKKFYLARFARIYPLYALSILVMVPRLFMNPANDPHPEHLEFFTAHPFRVSLGHVFALQSFDYRIGDVFNPPTWSISTEFLFYLVFPFVVPLIAKFRTRELPKLMALLFGFGLLFPLLYHNATFPIFAHFAGLKYNAVIDNFLNQATRMIFLFRLPEFMIGIVAFRFYREFGSLDRVWLVRNLRCFWVLSGIVFGGFLFFQPVGQIMRTALLTGQVFGVPFFLSSILLLVLAPGWMTKALSARWLVLLGEASFALYLFHLPIKQFVRFIVPKVLHFDAETPIILALTILFSVLISIPMFLFIEKPARDWVLKIARERAKTS